MKCSTVRSKTANSATFNVAVRRRNRAPWVGALLAISLLACSHSSSEPASSVAVGGSSANPLSGGSGGQPGFAGQAGAVSGAGGSGAGSWDAGGSGTGGSGAGGDSSTPNGGESAGGTAGSGGLGGAPPVPDAGAGGLDGGDGVLDIMPVGDSITNGSNGTNAGYRGPLYNLLRASGLNVLYVGSSVQGTVSTSVDPLPSEQRHHEGHSSYTISDVHNNLDGLDTATFEQYGGASRDPNGGHWFDGIPTGDNARPPVYPDIILLMIGTNDARSTDRQAVHDRLSALLTKITTLRPEAHLIVAQITPSNRPNNERYNAFVASEVLSLRQAGKRISVVDMYSDFPNDGMGGDEVHPNDKGYAFMAEQWFDGIGFWSDAR